MITFVTLENFNVVDQYFLREAIICKESILIPVDIGFNLKLIIFLMFARSVVLSNSLQFSIFQIYHITKKSFSYKP